VVADEVFADTDEMMWQAAAAKKGVFTVDDGNDVNDGESEIMEGMMDARKS